MLCELRLFIYKQKPLIKAEKNHLFSVYRDANVWPKAGVRHLHWATCQIFLEALFYR